MARAIPCPHRGNSARPWACLFDLAGETEEAAFLAVSGGENCIPIGSPVSASAVTGTDMAGVPAMLNGMHRRPLKSLTECPRGFAPAGSPAPVGA